MVGEVIHVIVDGRRVGTVEHEFARLWVAYSNGERGAFKTRREATEWVVARALAPRTAA